MSPSHTLTPILQTLNDSLKFQVWSGCTFLRCCVSASSAAAEVGAGPTSREVAGVRRRPQLGAGGLGIELAQPRGFLVAKRPAQPLVADLSPKLSSGPGDSLL